MPIPLDHARLVTEPNYKYAGLSEIGPAESDDGPEVKVRNVFWSWRWHCRIATAEDEHGKVRHYKLIGTRNQATALLDTLMCSDAWGIEQEHNAMKLLGTMLRHRQFKQYLLTGAFMEQSEQSGVYYLFRRLRPTLAITARSHDGSLKTLCGLCMHPIGYYERTWAGAMCPTDDVVAHLAMMRGDEHMFWRRCNQHPSYDPMCGI